MFIVFLQTTQSGQRDFFGGAAVELTMDRRLGGNPDTDVPFQWLYMFFEPDDQKLQKIRQDYRSGRLLTGELKQILIEKVTGFLHEHRKRREEAVSKVRLFKHDGALAQKMWKTDFEKL